MSVVTERKRGTIPLGKRPLPAIDVRQLDHRLAILIMAAGGLYLMERIAREVRDETQAYLRTVANPSLDKLERHVVAQLKQFVPRAVYDPQLTDAFEVLRYASELPPNLQRIINTTWHAQDRLNPVVHVAVGGAIHVSDRRLRRDGLTPIVIIS